LGGVFKGKGSPLIWGNKFILAKVFFSVEGFSYERCYEFLGEREFWEIIDASNFRVTFHRVGGSLFFGRNFRITDIGVNFQWDRDYILAGILGEFVRGNFDFIGHVFYDRIFFPHELRVNFRDIAAEDFFDLVFCEGFFRCGIFIEHFASGIVFLLSFYRRGAIQFGWALRAFQNNCSSRIRCCL
jgi:hypothetical protein